MKNSSSGRVPINPMAVFVFAVILMVIVAGCGGGGSENGTSEIILPLVLEGVFADSPVEGVHYETDTQAGFTDFAGRFHYGEGETITFHIGDVLLGSALAREFMTPVHLVAGAEDETHPVVTNMARFLQSLDADGNPDNGITITSEIRNQVMGRPISFQLSIIDFQNHPDVTALFDSLNAMGIFSHGEQHLIPVEQAQQHLWAHIFPGVNFDDLVMTGVFGYVPVQGLFYETDTLSGFTDFAGRFTYLQGEIIAFFIGETLLGHATAREFLSSVHLVEGATGETHPMVINMTRFLQSLDVDGNTDNGITITPEIVDGMFGWQIDFDFTMTNFETQPDMTGLFAYLNEMDLFFDGPHTLLSPEEALEHMWEHMGIWWNSEIVF